MASLATMSTRETERNKKNEITCPGLDSFFLDHFLKKTCLGFQDLSIGNHVDNFFAPRPFLQCGSQCKLQLLNFKQL